MGGNGSTRWRGHKLRTRVEACPIFLDVRKLVAEGLLEIPHGVLGSLTWTADEDTALVYASFHLEPLRGDGRYLNLTVRTAPPDVPSLGVKQRIRLAALGMPNGGQRWLLHCPTCARRCRLVYVAPREDRFSCRECLGLLYEASRRSDRRVSFFRRHPEEWAEALQRFVRGARDGPTWVAVKMFCRMVLPPPGAGSGGDWTSSGPYGGIG